MTDYTLRIPETSKASALLNYLKSLDFIELTKTTDWWDELNSEAKNSIEIGLKQADEGNLTPNKDARKRIDNFFQKNA